MNRRKFIHKSGLGLTAVLAGGDLPWNTIATAKVTKLTILHTNDVHSRIDPFPDDGGKFAGMGGVARRAQLVERIRKEEANVMLLDSGDIFQGTPYFNFFGGELEFKLMSQMGYDASTIGNHDFDAGLEGLVKQLPHANFPFINVNYDFSDTLMHDKVIPFKVFEFGKLRVGVIGVGIELDSLVPDRLFGNTKYLDPIVQANKWALELKNDHQCDYIICLSHLGYKYNSGKIDDQKFAKSSSNIDLILGGHTHTFMPRPEVHLNTDEKPVTVNQVGWAGLVLGRLDIYFEYNRKDRCLTCKNEWVG